MRSAVKTRLTSLTELNDSSVLTVPAAGRVNARFRFIDVFAGIGGMRGGLELANGVCVSTIEKDPAACRTYSANWEPVQPVDVTMLDPATLPPYELLAAGFPCQPFSLAGVVKKESMARAELRRANLEPDEETVRRTHGFSDPVSGNMFFQIIRLVGGPWNLPPEEVQREATTPDWLESEFLHEGRQRAQADRGVERMPPVLLLENVRNLAAHDQGRTLRVIRRRLLRTGYYVSHKVISAAHWVPQRRQRIFIVALHMGHFGGPFTFPPEPADMVGLGPDFFEKDPIVLRDHSLSPGTWAALERHKARHAEKENGFGYGVASLGRPTRTLSARYYKDGAEILVNLPEDIAQGCGVPYRRLTLPECARLMGFCEPFLRKPFVFPEKMRLQLYKQFGNAVVIPQVGWLAEAIELHAREVFRGSLSRRPAVERSQ